MKEEEEAVKLAVVDPLEVKMKTATDEIDSKYEEEMKTLAEEKAKTSGYAKLAPYNNPFYLIIIATFGAIISGSVQPILGVVFAKLLGLLTAPLELLDAAYGEDYL